MRYGRRHRVACSSGTRRADARFPFVRSLVENREPRAEGVYLSAHRPFTMGHAWPLLGAVMPNNGRLPDSELRAVPGGRLRTDAAQSWLAMRAYIGKNRG